MFFYNLPRLGTQSTRQWRQIMSGFLDVLHQHRKKGQRQSHDREEQSENVFLISHPPFI